MRHFIVLVSHESVRYLVKVSRYRVFQIQRNFEWRKNLVFQLSVALVLVESQGSAASHGGGAAACTHVWAKLFGHDQKHSKIRNTFSFLCFASYKLSRINRGFRNSTSNRPQTQFLYKFTLCLCTRWSNRKQLCGLQSGSGDQFIIWGKAVILLQAGKKTALALITLKQVGKLLGMNYWMTAKTNKSKPIETFSDFCGVTHSFEEPLPPSGGPRCSVSDCVWLFEVFFGGWMAEVELDNRPWILSHVSAGSAW